MKSGTKPQQQLPLPLLGAPSNTWGFRAWPLPCWALLLCLGPISYFHYPGLHPNLPTWLSGLTLLLLHHYGLAVCLLGSCLSLFPITRPGPGPDFTALVSWHLVRAAAAPACFVTLGSWLGFPCKSTCPCSLLTMLQGKCHTFKTCLFELFWLIFCSLLLSPKYWICLLVLTLTNGHYKANAYGYSCNHNSLRPTSKSLHPSWTCPSPHTNDYLISSKLKLFGWVVSGNDLAIGRC